MSTQFFEGPEKKVELVVTGDTPALRSFGDARWQAVVEAAGAKVISTLRNDDCTAYLLSESSLFVYDDWLVMITCGQTTLVEAVEVILSFIPREAVALLVYERKNEHFPGLQPTSFHRDAERLNALLPGKASRFGGEYGHCLHVFHTTRPFHPDRDDPTLEVLMHGIDEEVAHAFRTEPPAREQRLDETVGIRNIFPGFDISDYAFEPAGYSLNALKDSVYYTLHVTPQRLGSYVSFETNYDFSADLSGIVGRVIELFRPRSFNVVTFLPDGRAECVVPGYQLADHVEEPLGGYHVGFFQYFRPPSGPRAAHRLSLG